MADPPRKVRLTIHYEGRVQGVGFRWQTVRCVQALPVTGFVRNLTDGRVLLVVEADEAAAQEARGAVEGALGHYIRGSTAQISPATGEFSTFEVRR